MTSFKMRELRREDFDLVRNLYAATKNRLRGEAYDYWRFFDTPWGDSPAVIAIDRNVCAGLLVLWPTMLDLGGEDVLGAQVMDTMTHQDYRGRGLFLSLAEECFRIAASRGFEVLYSFPNSNSFPGFIRRLNFDHVGDVFAWKYHISSFRMPSLAGDARRRTAAGSEIDGIEPDKLQTLIRVTNDERDVCRIKHDQTWLTWRYAKASSEVYQWHAVRGPDGDIQAAVLVGERDDSWGGYGKGELRIHEAFTHSEDALAVLLAALTRRAKGAARTVVKMLVKDVRVESALRKAQFRPAEPHPLIVRKLTARRLSGNVHHFPAWRIVGGDIDSF
jgi:GNAT superfamily N-acetyltransferase